MPEESGVDTARTYFDVRFCAAVGGIADVKRPGRSLLRCERTTSRDDP